MQFYRSYRLWIEKDRILTKALIYHERVMNKWEAALKQAGWDQASKIHNTPLPKKNGSQELIWEETNQSTITHFCHGLQRKFLKVPKDIQIIWKTQSIILEKMPWLLTLPKCYTKHQFSSHFPFHEQTWIFFLVVVSSQSKWSLRDPVNSLFPLSQTIISLHYSTLLWPHELSFPVHTIMSRSARIWGLEV